MAVDMQSVEEMFSAISPLLEMCTPTKQMFDFFCKVCLQILTSCDVRIR